MENREANVQGCNAERLESVRRLRYHRPALVEYGDVSKLTAGGGTDPRADSSNRVARKRPP
jgi:hypothetical protein